MASCTPLCPVSPGQELERRSLLFTVFAFERYFGDTLRNAAEGRKEGLQCCLGMQLPAECKSPGHPLSCTEEFKQKG